MTTRVLYFPPGEYVTSPLTPLTPPPVRPPTAVGAGDADDGIEWFNVKDFGAVGDGVTDDTEAIRRAIDAVNGAT